METNLTVAAVVVTVVGEMMALLAAASSRGLGSISPRTSRVKSSTEKPRCTEIMMLIFLLLPYPP